METNGDQEKQRDLRPPLKKFIVGSVENWFLMKMIFLVMDPWEPQYWVRGSLNI